MAGTTTITIQTLQHGQPAPYADHVFEYRIVVVDDPLDNGMIRPAHPEIAEKTARLICATSPDGTPYLPRGERDTSSLDGYAAPFLDEIEHEGPGTIRIRTILPYID